MTHFGLGPSSELSLEDPQGLLALFACLLAWIAWGSSANTLGVSADCLGTGAGCLAISTLCLGTTCLRGNSALSLWELVPLLIACVLPACGGQHYLLGGGADCLGRGTGCLDISTLCLGTTCLRSAGCLGTSTL